ncbi:MAG: flagellar basal body rod protein FlgC [Gemmataceae bacterium]|nr:flagellar basal body rod protein FlgC [Gemmata sp.]MDW8199023.1 flagellar basal body rod protein FlgC [Gemmataceae bacterium]
MPFQDVLGAGAISASGLAAERLRMEVIANNIANANSTRSANGGPYRRQDVVFAEVLDDSLRPLGLPAFRGVQAVALIEDPSELPRIYLPGHPDADANGFVAMPNVQLPIEMVNLVTAARAYEANLRTAQTFRQMNEQALVLLRG